MYRWKKLNTVEMEKVGKCLLMYLNKACKSGCAGYFLFKTHLEIAI